MARNPFRRFISTRSTLIGIGGGLVGSLVTAFLLEHWEHKREQREALQSLVEVWHGGYIGRHRDEITTWMLGADGVTLRNLPRDSYGAALLQSVDETPDALVSILAVTGFFRTVDICIRDDRCDEGRTHAAFGPSAREFHDLFGPLLRHLDCELGYSGTEDPLLSVARRKEAAAPERCNPQDLPPD